MLLISGNSNTDLSLHIAGNMKKPLVSCFLGKFNNGETNIKIFETIRGKDIVIIQSGYSPYNYMSVNDIVMETCLLIDACRRSMAKNITLIIPLFPYSRQDRKDSSRAPISASYFAKMLEVAGVTRVVSIDLHAPQIQGFFSPNIPVDNLYTVKLVNQKLINLFNINKIENKKKYLLIAPDAGAVKRTFKFAKVLGLKTCIMHKERDYSNSNNVKKTILICDNEENFENKIGIILDDMIDSGGTFLKACETLIKKDLRKLLV